MKFDMWVIDARFSVTISDLKMFFPVRLFWGKIEYAQVRKPLFLLLGFYDNFLLRI